jgi:hypothetical protein
MPHAIRVEGQRDRDSGAAALGGDGREVHG